MFIYMLLFIYIKNVCYVWMNGGIPSRRFTPSIFREIYRYRYICIFDRRKYTYYCHKFIDVMSVAKAQFWFIKQKGKKYCQAKV